MKASDIERLKNIALSDKDVLKLVEGKARIMLYSDLYKCKTLDEALGKHGAMFLLYQVKPSYGHWCAVFKLDDKTVEFFDPYGLMMDSELNWIPKDFRKVSHQLYPHLTALFYYSPYNLTYNEHKFQHKGSGIKTCGRWSAMRIACRDWSLEKFTRIFKNVDSDDLVTLLTTPDLNY